jgi:hypothetical protein
MHYEVDRNGIMIAFEGHVKNEHEENKNGLLWIEVARRIIQHFPAHC